MGGVYQIDTSSWNSIVDINSALSYIRGLVGRVVMVPLTLKREPMDTHHEGKKQVHYPIKLEYRGTPEQLAQLRRHTHLALEREQYQLPSPVEENPEMDAVDETVDESTGEVVKSDIPQPENDEHNPQNEKPADKAPEKKQSGQKASPSFYEITQSIKAAKSVDELNKMIPDIQKYPGGQHTALMKEVNARIKQLTRDEK